MTNPDYGGMWKVLSEHPFSIESITLNEDLTCILCKQLMVDACQSVCGCRYCHKCIRDYLTTVDRYCPGNSPECKEEELILDRDILKNVTLNRKISKVIVKCDKCLSNFQLMEMEEHLGSCDNELLTCPYLDIGCSSGAACASDLRTHFDKEMINHARLMKDFRSNFINEVDELKQQVKINQFEILSLKNELKENKREIFMLTNELRCVASELRAKETNAEFLEQQLCGKNDEIGPIDKTPEINIKQKEDKDGNMSVEFTEMKEDFLSRFIKTKDYLDENSIQICELVSLVDTFKKELTSMNTFEYVWKVEHFSTVIRKIFGSKNDAYSDEFYTHNNGYKMQLCMYRSKFEAEKYLVIFLSLVPGTFDRILRWPFKGTVTLGIIDQNIGSIHFPFVANYETATDKFNNVFHRPKKNHKEGYGYHIKLSELLASPAFVVEDTVFVKCSVSFERLVDGSIVSPSDVDY